MSAFCCRRGVSVSRLFTCVSLVLAVVCVLANSSLKAQESPSSARLLTVAQSMGAGKAPGQGAAVYEGDRLLGGGWIEAATPVEPEA